MSFTCSVNVEVRGFVGDVADRLQSWSAGLDSGRVAHRLGDVDHEGTSVDVLSSKQHLQLEEDTGGSEYQTLELIKVLID